MAGGERNCGAKLTAAVVLCLLALFPLAGSAAARLRGQSCTAERGSVAVSGRVLYAAGVGGGRLVTAFNGRKSFKAKPDAGGRYCVQVAGSTGGTQVALFATAVGAVPEAADV